ncbi:MAG: flavin reductase [Planctomycetes bacterium HGW-Planctomycetes-1]|nr:MAG: flavin reductase [Planctomycetes bacterium HGW-Planctomycetes-1]
MQKKADYAEAIKTKYPEQIIIAVAKDKNGKANPVTIGWTMLASGEPPMLAIALTPKRYTTAAIRESKCFTVVYPSEDMTEFAMFFGTHSGRDCDKFAETGCKISPAERIDSVIIDDAVANFECILESEQAAGDHIIFVGKVIACHINTEPKGRLYSVAPGHKLGGVKKK